MKKKNEFSLLNLIDFITEKFLDFAKNIGKMITSKKSHDTVYIFSKLIVTLVVLAIIKIPFDFFRELGVMLIYSIGNTFRSFLSTCLKLTIDISYLVLCLVVLLRVFDSIWKNKEINFIEDNRRKDAKVKNKVFEPLVKFVKVVLGLTIIPLIIMFICVMSIFIINLSFATKGYALISLFFISGGFLIMITSVIMLVIEIIKGGNVDE